MHILVVDDEPSMRDVLEILFTRAGFEVTCAGSVKDATMALGGVPFDLVLTDMKLGSGSGMEVLRAARALKEPPEVIVITAFGTAASAVEAMREGAYHYICKPFDNEELRLLVQKALEKKLLRQENRSLRAQLAPGAGMLAVGRSPRMEAIMGLVEKVAASRTTVLIYGESGTGKELIARALHLKSPRAGHPFLPVNCAALSEGVLESELFGHVKGAFTGATTDRLGLLASAGEGTVLLDEIGEVPPAMQVKLLRVLQERKVKPVGSSQEVPFQARLVAATNRNLDAEVKAGRFREDLLYRLNVITLELPPLRERAEDIPLLASHFLARLIDELGRPGLHFTQEALKVLAGYAWPGNVRQLQNIIERAVTLSEGDALGPETLPATLRGEPAIPAGDVQVPVGFSLERFLDDSERRYLLAALKRTDGVKTRAAELLGLSFRSFRYRLAKHGLVDELEDPRQS
ncbi:sigma-54 dependent transcriptional regulator [Comamonas sp. JC664]|uniref:sigma-54-dependent transcriptional regulator n=1 Tax=Comamonas sp. JC664 TaxID=2801917 RepID=UPI00174ACC4B|nr:sigma-54 dependent transcriptional regulator [Comamonas sp. JC664]MBL0695973.1 sigma-54-dependent Fis family transcriptional regulator [Comamonas sp. JC664]